MWCSWADDSGTLRLSACLSFAVFPACLPFWTAHRYPPATTNCLRLLLRMLDLPFHLALVHFHLPHVVAPNPFLLATHLPLTTCLPYLPIPCYLSCPAACLPVCLPFLPACSACLFKVALPLHVVAFFSACWTVLFACLASLLLPFATFEGLSAAFHALTMQLRLVHVHTTMHAPALNVASEMGVCMLSSLQPTCAC